MFQKLKQLTGESLVYGLSGVVSRFISFFLVPVYTRVFTPADYGVLGMVSAVSAIIAMFVILGLDSAAIRYYYDTVDTRDRETTVVSWIVFYLTVSVAFAVLLALSSEYLALQFLGSADHALLFRLLALIIPLDGIGTISINLLRAQRRPWVVVGLNVGKTLLTVLLTILFVVVLGQGLRGVYLAMLSAVVPYFLANLWILRPWLRWCRFSRGRLCELLKYGLPLVPAGMAYWIISALDRFFLERYSGLSDVGLFALATSIASALALVVSAFQQAWGPFSMSIRLEANCKQVYAAVLTYYLALTVGVAVALSVFVSEILSILATKAYYGAGVAVSYLSFSLIGFGAYYIAARGVSEVKKTAHIGWTTLVAAGVSIILNLVLIPLLGVAGAAIAALAAQWTSAGLLFWMSQRYYPIPYRWREVVILLLTSALLVAVGTRIHTDHIVTTVALKLVWLSLYPCVILATGIVTRQQLRSLSRHLKLSVRYVA